MPWIGHSGDAMHCPDAKLCVQYAFQALCHMQGAEGGQLVDVCEYQTLARDVDSSRAKQMKQALSYSTTTVHDVSLRCSDCPDK